jgi:BolA protein
MSISPASERLERIRVELQRALNVESIELFDDSHLHAGHAGARDGKGHFRVRLVSTDFSGLRTLQRHQLIYRALADMMLNDIHALSIAALTPAEAGAAAHTEA